MKQEFALDRGGPKRLKITFAFGLKNAEVFIDRKRIGTFATQADFERGAELTLPDGSALSVRYGPVSGAPFMKGFHLLHDGAPIPGSAADPVPKWAWPFMIACAIIPVISLGGAVPAVIAIAGVGGMLSVSRNSRWSTALRAGACALIVVASWGSFALLLTAAQAARGGTFVTTSSRAKLMEEIQDTYTRQGVRHETILRLMSNLRETCDGMEEDKQCVDYLRSSLQTIKNPHNTN